MRFSLSFHIPKALPSLSPPHFYRSRKLFPSSSPLKQSAGENTSSEKQELTSRINPEKIQESGNRIPLLAIQAGAALATVGQPAFAITGENNYEVDLTWVLIQLGISAVLYFIVCPPIIMNWLRTRWYKRNLLEMYFQFMFVFLFFPGVLVWAPFLNFRKFPRDPSMKYPWSVPENPSQVKGGFLKYPWAQPEDYE